MSSNRKDDRPYLSSFLDRHGKRRWRFRRSGKTVSLPGSPGEAEFEEAYKAAIEGRPRKRVLKAQHLMATRPRSFKAAWFLVIASAEWKRLDQATQKKNRTLAEDFLLRPVVPDQPVIWGDVPVADMKRRHIKLILSEHADTPHKAKHLLGALRKMIRAALDEEWIDVDPSWKIKWRPEYTGWRSWTEDEMAAFEARWPLGSTPRTVYGLALWLGSRRSDVTTLKWSQIDFTRASVHVTQKKTGKRLVLPMTPMLLEILEATPRRGETVVVTQHGKPFSEKSLTGRMRDWTTAAGLPNGCTVHGLRKTLGKLLAETGATTRQIMSQLGHDDIEHAELYSREAEQARMARDAMTRLTRARRIKKVPSDRDG